MRSLITLLLGALIFSACNPLEERDDSYVGWLVGIQGESETYRATVPGCVHADLLANGIIEDPYYGTNEEDLQWIGEESWVYSMFITPEEDEIGKDNIEIVFEGLDTYAKVYLNNSLLFEADNMYRTWTADVKSILHEGENKLEVIFSPPEQINEQKAAELQYKLPDDRAFTRKAPYHFGWDWGPKFVTCGIWRPVYLRAWNEIRIDNIHINHGDIASDPLPIGVEVEVQSDKERDVMVLLFDDFDQQISEEMVSLQEGQNLIMLEGVIPEPKLWWPAGMGEQNLYRLGVQVTAEEEMEYQTATFGVREIKLVQEADATGETFYFKVNGLPIFMKGANYIPQDNFLPDVKDENYEKLIRSVIEANMNMLRVWGGGIYEEDIFYELCDEHGILVWQDFMFACNMYPGDEAFLDNVRHEAIDNVKRLSNHPSIALWCGNNEIDEGWHNWGWQDQLEYSDEDSAKVWNDYLKLFHGILPEVVEAYDPGTIYHPSSPMTGWGRDEAYTKGDVHYWGVWWGEEPFEMYQKKLGRFVSEYGFQGMPPMETIESYGGAPYPTFNTQHPTSDVLEAHQKHPRGTQLIQKYMEREFIVPEKFEDYVYISQVLQAEGMAQAFLTHRASQPYCMGTLYWQLNDCWPVTSWSGLDYYGRWKALHYHVKRAYQPVMVNIVEKNGQNEVYVVNDNPYPVNVKFVLENYSVNRMIRTLIDKDEIIPALKSWKVGIFPSPNENRSRLFNLAKIIVDEKVVSRCFHYYVPNKELSLEDPELNWKVNGNKITLKAEKLARQVFLEAKGIEGRFSDNFFDMAPGETREIKYIGDADQAELLLMLKVKSTYDTYN